MGNYCITSARPRQLENIKYFTIFACAKVVYFFIDEFPFLRYTSFYKVNTKRQRTEEYADGRMKESLGS